MRWAEFEQAAPELAARGRELIERFGFVFVGTVRRDGGPRVDPAELHFVDGDVAMALVPGSFKARDLRRDPRAYLQTPVVDPASGQPGEVKLRARAVHVTDAGLRGRIAEAIEERSGWRPTDDWFFCTFDIEGAAFLRWGDEAEVHRLVRWTPERGCEHSTRRYI